MNDPQRPTRAPRLADLANAGRVRQVLDRAEFREEAILALIGGSDLRAVTDDDLPQLLHRTAGGGPLATLVRLFLMGVAVDLDAAREAVAPMSLDEWERIGLLSAAGEEMQAAVRLVPALGLLVAHDPPPGPGQDFAVDYVMGIGASTLSLARHTVRRHVAASLDLGTGCGLLAFLAAPHSGRVAAVDSNSRAVAMAAFNARLNGLDNVDCLEGHFFGPVAGESFGLIVANPPFVISPESRYIYRDSGMPGDAMVRMLLRESARHLDEGGFLLMMCNWAHVAGEDWQDRLEAWCEGTGCDAWVLRMATLDPPAYAAKWIRHTERDDAETARRRLDAWVAYYAENRIEAVSGGIVTLRRRSGERNWFRASDSPERTEGDAGESVALGFELRDFLEAADGGAGLLDACFTRSPHLRVEQELEPAAEGWALRQARFRLASGLGFTGEADAVVIALAARCDGSTPLRQIAEGLAGELGTDASAVRDACVDVVRRLVERGFLLPAKKET